MHGAIQWLNFAPYLCQLVFAAMLQVITAPINIRHCALLASYNDDTDIFLRTTDWILFEQHDRSSPLTLPIMSCCTHKMAVVTIDSVTSLQIFRKSRVWSKVVPEGSSLPLFWGYQNFLLCLGFSRWFTGRFSNPAPFHPLRASNAFGALVSVRVSILSRLCAGLI